jgi:hypothetical protein
VIEMDNVAGLYLIEMPGKEMSTEERERKESKEHMAHSLF